MRKKSQTHISKHTGCDSIPESRPHSRFLPGRQVGEYFPLPTTSAKPNKHTAPAGRPEVGELGPRATQLEASADQSQPGAPEPWGPDTVPGAEGAVPGLGTGCNFRPIYPC